MAPSALIGIKCPFKILIFHFIHLRHEIDVRDEQLKTQAIKDRYYGTNDPVANKILDKLPEHFESSEVSDASITTLVLFGNMTGMTDLVFRPHFSVFGDIESIRIISGSNCAFVKFSDRPIAEAAFQRLCKTGLKVADNSFKVAWAKTKKK